MDEKWLDMLFRRHEASNAATKQKCHEYLMGASSTNQVDIGECLEVVDKFEIGGKW